jgi:diguanylate cyclase (GGDEF)-like protein
VISLKKYLDMDANLPSASEPQPDELSSATLESYRSALLAMGQSAVRACPTLSSELQRGLIGLEKRLSHKITPSVVKSTGKNVEEQLHQWGNRTAEYFKTKAEDVKELLLALARTAESMGERDQHYAKQFTEFTSRLHTIANLDDLGQVRASLVRGASELKSCVDQMAQDSKRSVAELRAEVSNYETKLRTAEQLALRDALTGLANRHNIDERLEWRITHGQAFCVVLLDLNGFKQVNDTYGHLAGDSLLKQFAEELRSNARPSDVVGRWGGDEFVMVLDCDLTGARALVDRVKRVVLGEYTIQLGAGAGEAKVQVDASIGVAQWHPGEVTQQVIANADAAMYQQKELSQKAKAAGAGR